jgi:uncharacterized membrane protein
VVLPEGIAPAGVTAVKLPSGWTFTRRADGFTVGGKALRTGTDAKWSVRIAKLPDDQTRLSFKTLETYGDGEISRWIEIQEAGQAEPDNPAPLLTLKPAASTAPATPSAVPSAPASAEAPVPAPATAQAQEPAATTSGSSTWWIWVGVGALLMLGGVLFVLRRRGGRRTD